MNSLLRRLIAWSVLLVASMTASTVAGAQGAAPTTAFSTYAQRLARAYSRLGNDLLIIRSRWALAGATDAAFDQEPSFFYFTGDERLLGAVLVIDGATRRAELFVPNLPPPLRLFAPSQAGPAGLSPSSVHVDHVSDWNAFASYVDDRLSHDPRPTIYVDDGGYAGGLAGALGTPFDRTTLGNPWLVWRRSIQQRWPNAAVQSGGAIISQVRAVKDSGEIGTLRQVAAASAVAWVAGLHRVAPGRRQREVEAAVVEACVRNGGDVSFWPWAMSGPNSAFPTPFTSLDDPRHLDRAMQAGDVVRLDIGCQVDHYQGDVGRTVPVSGAFSAGQAEVVDLLVAAYRAGLGVLRDGATVSDVIRASVAEVARRQPALRTSLGRDAAAVITRPDGIPFWQLHGIGLDPAEGLPDTLHAGMTMDYEPIFVVGDQGFYMEDMILVTPAGFEILTTGLPYTAAEIERAMRPRGNRE
ncbi:MAG TPA: aminopeptidase P N-terminal domain-containing protein [Gemmatimonadales bacterium]|nr:aminopeptidase P N-terminal domain-containing protein [Gemmatimonadales bacterium]